MLTEGFHDVPQGHVATIVTYLEMTRKPAITATEFPGGVDLQPMTQVDPATYRELFRRVGGLPWLWFTRLVLPEAELADILQHPDVEVFAVMQEGRAEGLLELDFRTADACELAYFGLTPALIGTGCGRALMSEAINRAFARPISRFHVHTCTLDSPQALGFYIRSGFTPIRQQVEIAPDPRLTGLLPREAGPHIPIFSG